MTKTIQDSTHETEFDKRVSDFVSSCHLAKAYIDEHPKPARLELVTRGDWTRDEALAGISSRLHWRFASERADDIIYSGKADADDSYVPDTLETIAASAGEHLTIQGVQHDIEVVAIELLGLLWRLEDAGLISRTQTVVEAAS